MHWRNTSNMCEYGAKLQSCNNSLLIYWNLVSIRTMWSDTASHYDGSSCTTGLHRVHQMVLWNQLPPPPFYRPILNHSHGFHTPIRSRCPNHLNLSCFTLFPFPKNSSKLPLNWKPSSVMRTSRTTTTATLCTPRRLYKSTLRFLSFSDTPHIHLTIIFSFLSKLCRFAFFIDLVSVSYVNTPEHKSLIFFPLCGMIHLELWG